MQDLLLFFIISGIFFQPILPHDSFNSFAFYYLILTESKFFNHDNLSKKKKRERNNLKNLDTRLNNSCMKEFKTNL